MNKKIKAVFLDRDGVINKNKDDYVKNIAELEFLQNIEKPIRELNKKNFFVVIITNQSAINRGLTTVNNVKIIHEKIQEHLHQHNAHFDDLYFCPHTPIENCFCRKPNPGLLLQAIDEHNIDPKKSWMIGDRNSDIIAGKKAGCKTILIEPNFNLANAVKQIVKNDSNK
jgi:D-glycero-D-manno-heptose 1,7-bisphosphate phosphatase